MKITIDDRTEKLTIDDMMDAILTIRAEARANKDYALADEIRKRLTELGISVEDRDGVTHWRARTGAYGTAKLFSARTMFVNKVAYTLSMFEESCDQYRSVTGIDLNPSATSLDVDAQLDATVASFNRLADRYDEIGYPSAAQQLRELISSLQKASRAA